MIFIMLQLIAEALFITFLIWENNGSINVYWLKMTELCRKFAIINLKHILV